MNLKWPRLENGEPENFLLFVQNFNITINASVMLASNKKLQYLRNLIHGEELSQYYNLCAQFRSTTMAHLNPFILGIGTYFFTFNALSKPKRVVQRGTRKSHK